MPFYTKYKKALEANGYTVDDRGCVTDSMGNQAAAEDAWGNVQCKDPNVTAICIEEEEAATLAKLAKAKPKKKVAPVVEDND